MRLADERTDGLEERERRPLSVSSESRAVGEEGGVYVCGYVLVMRKRPMR